MKLRPVLVLLCALGLLACEETRPGTAQSCADIIDACHDVDPGTGEVHDCHETAHDVATAEACDPISARCVMLCEALEPADGGHADHDAGHSDHDAGHAGHDAAP